MGLPIKAYRSGLRRPEIVIYSIAFWPAMALATWLSGAVDGAIGVLSMAVIMVPLFFVLGRRATIVVPEGIRVVPYLWPATTYPWEQIEDIRIDVSGHTRHGHTIYGVGLFLAGGRRKWLHSLGSLDLAAEELRGFLQQHRSTAAATPAVPPLGFDVRAHPRQDLLFGGLLALAGLAIVAASIGGSVGQTALAQNGVVTQATVTDKQPKSCSAKGGCHCALTWSFTDGSGAAYAGRSDDCSSLYDEARRGGMVQVIYDPADPTVNQTTDKKPDPAAPAAGGALLAYVVLGLGVALVAGATRQLRATPAR